MYGKYIVHPIALTALAQILKRGWPKMGGKEAVKNSSQIIKALHEQGLQVGPAEAFGENRIPVRSVREETKVRPTPRRTPVRGDAFDNFMEELRKTEEQKPWEIR